ncbi:fused MFS/spermidine synthase [Actinokineospora auranticolor]|uniref:Spermidine synthase n=1 Tax=Actinokineospora auranticolor TaxID=155976 RepID=A0A2S6GMD5_9PSEU|nr:fused MFS/spermidine synthase [Actinokineospora auranticolor]PPK66385.1 spermidine synthase [Actinokineospora auranticolor]
MNPTQGRYPVRFGTAEILRDLDHPTGWLLSVDGVAQSYVDTANPRHLEFDYVRRLAEVVDSHGEPGTPVEAVHLGGGACTLPRYIAAVRPGSRQRVFDADEGMVELVRGQFGVDSIPGLELTVADGRAAVSCLPDASADVVVVDAFERGTLAGALYGLEATRDISRVLRADGLYMANLSDGPDLKFTSRAVATLSAVFGSVLLLAEPPVLRGRRHGNIVLAAAATGLPVAEIAAKEAAAPFPARCVTAAELRALVGPATPLTDNDPTPPPVPPSGLFSQ